MEEQNEFLINLGGRVPFALARGKYTCTKPDTFLNTGDATMYEIRLLFLSKVRKLAGSK